MIQKLKTAAALFACLLAFFGCIVALACIMAFVKSHDVRTWHPAVEMR